MARFDNLMLPFFFGSGQRRLFGIYEPAARRGRVARAALLCNSWGTEYLNAHRAMRVLAKRLSAAGFDTLRFDYFGAGDSGGETTDAELRGWRDDIASAAAELKDMSGALRVTLVGLRLGGTLVAEVAPRLDEDIDGIVLWDPIVRGLDYVRELSDQTGTDGEFSKVRPSRKSDGAAILELGGHSVSSAFVTGLRAIDLCSREQISSVKTLIIFTSDPPPNCKLLTSPGAGFNRSSESALIKADSPWKDPAERSETLPVEVYERILEWAR